MIFLTLDDIFFIQIALSACTIEPNLIDIQALVDYTIYARNMMSIDNPANLKDSRVWIFSGKSDTIVVQVCDTLCLLDIIYTLCLLDIILYCSCTQFDIFLSMMLFVLIINIKLSTGCRE